MPVALCDTVSVVTSEHGEVYGVVDAYQIHVDDEARYLVRFFDDGYKERQLWLRESEVRKVKLKSE